MTVLVLIGVVLCFVVARWRALTAPAVLAVYVAIASGVDEVPPWFSAFEYGAVGAIGVVAVVLLRRQLKGTTAR